MSFLHALALGIVEGLTEFLPVSSTGHLILASRLLGLSQTEFLKTFEIAIQLGAILAVVALYARRVLSAPRQMLAIGVAFLPTAIAGVTLYPFIKRVLFSEWIVVAALAIGGIGMIFFERWQRNRGSAARSGTPSLSAAFMIGMWQILSMVPGVSRAAATIYGGLFSGMDRRSSVEFSFLLALPTMAAATGLDLLKSPHVFTSQEWMALAVGGAVSFVVAMLTMRWLIRFVQAYDFTRFAVYRIAVAILFTAAMFLA